MTDIFVVVRIEWSSTSPEAVFSSYELAKKYVAGQSSPSGYWIECFVLDAGYKHCDKKETTK